MLDYQISLPSQKTCAARHKGFHCVNVHPSLQFLANFGMKHMPDKLRERVKFYSSFDEVDVVEKKDLPKEYGGTMPIKEMIGNLTRRHSQASIIFKHLIPEPWRKILEATKDFFLSYSNMKVNRKLYPTPVLNCVVDTLKIPLNSSDLFEKTSNCVDEELTGIQGSFRKLEID